MLTFEDCLAFCELSEEEIAAISQHERVPEIIAIELGQYLIHTDNGERCISRMMLEDIIEHRKCGDTKRVEHLESVLKHFVATHPKAQERRHSYPRSSCQ